MYMNEKCMIADTYYGWPKMYLVYRTLSIFCFIEWVSLLCRCCCCHRHFFAWFRLFVCYHDEFCDYFRDFYGHLHRIANEFIVLWMFCLTYWPFHMSNHRINVYLLAISFYYACVIFPPHRLFHVASSDPCTVMILPSGCNIIEYQYNQINA